MKISCAEIEKHDHAFSLFNTDDEFIGYAVSMIRRSLSAHEQCMVLTDDISSHDIKRYLDLLDLSSENLIHTGQLLFRRLDRFSMPSGDFRPVEIVHNVEKTVRAALKQGFSGLRSVWEVGHTLDKISFYDLVAYEVGIQGLFFQYPISEVCAYRKEALGEVETDRLLDIHPFHLVRTLNYV